MASLRCPRCSSVVEIGSGPKPHCTVCNFPYRDSRPIRESSSVEAAPGAWTPPVEAPHGRPHGLTAVGLIVIAGGAAIVAFGFMAASAVVPALAVALPVLHAFRVSVDASGLVVGGAAIVQGLSLLRGARPAWTVQVAFVLGSLAVDVPHVFEGGTVVLVRVALCAFIGA